MAPPDRWNQPHDVSMAQLVIFSYCHCKAHLSAKTLYAHYVIGIFYGLWQECDHKIGWHQIS